MSKPVSMIELFYDLVFVYMIAKATELIHVLHHGVVAPFTLLTFAFVVIVFINSWMVQSVFVNRYGRSSWTDIGFMFADMMIVLYMSNSFSPELNADLRPFYLAAGLLSFTLFLQYLLVLVRTDDPVDQAIVKRFMVILALRTVGVGAASLLPNQLGLVVAFLSVAISWIAPAFTGKLTRQHPIIFSHLLERLTELSIVMFGETIVGIAGYFTKTTFSLVSVMIFAIVASLFFTYITVFDHLVNENREGESGNLLIYLHYPIIFGISMITVSLRFITERAANGVFAISFLYGGIALLYLGLWLARGYQHDQYQLGNTRYWVIAGILPVAYVAALVLSSALGTIVVTLVATLCCCALLVGKIYQARA
ncbi:low temperature requirement protein A [Lacticaseibacillus porcinae]|uniref:low temperature requirement protein A n=1 Tax=Lacticaseibacillus porcinae TaxID=1123687 RepID=UPI000F790E46|nr:low temperature requirement protein A [Lacticaseibacillus porcinae]